MATPDVVTIQKKKKKDKIGIQFEKQDDGSLFVSFIRPGGLADKSDIAIGDKIDYVNDMECAGKEPMDVVEYIKITKGAIKFTRGVKKNEKEEETFAEEIVVLADGEGLSQSFECQIEEWIDMEISYQQPLKELS